MYCRVATPFVGLHLGFLAAPLVCCIFRQCGLRAGQFGYVYMCVCVGGWVAGCAASLHWALLAACCLLAASWLSPCDCSGAFAFFIFTVYTVCILARSLSHPCTCCSLCSNTCYLRLAHGAAFAKIDKDKNSEKCTSCCHCRCPGSHIVVPTCMYICNSIKYIYRAYICAYIGDQTLSRTMQQSHRSSLTNCSRAPNIERDCTLHFTF